jgi:phage terminase large subunit-like protein
MARHSKPRVPPTTWQDSRQPERSLEKSSLDHFERFCFKLKLPDTFKPFVLEEYQLESLGDFYTHGAMEHLWEWPTGQGKSTLLGALVLHHGTFIRVNPNVIVLGGLGGHAKHTLNAASWFISQSPMLQMWWVSQEYGMGRIKSLIKEDSRGQIAASSAGMRKGGRGGSSQEGEAPTLVVVEELHRHEDNGAAVRTLTTKVQKRSVGNFGVKIVHATTAGDSLESPLGRMEKRATAEGSDIKITGFATRAVDPEGDLVMHRLAVPENVGMPDSGVSPEALDTFLQIVKKANPASFITIAGLRRSWKATSSEPWVFARQHMNQWITQAQNAFSRFDWASCEKASLAIPAGARGVVVGVDMATTYDTTAIVPVWINPVTGRPQTCGTVVKRSQEGGTRRRARDVVDVLEAMRVLWPDMTIAFDRAWGGGLIAEQFEEDHGLTIVDHGQGQPMEVAAMLLGELLTQHGLDHDGNPNLTQHVLSAAARPTMYGRRWRIEKPRSGEHIDAAIALAMALNVAMQLRTTNVNVDDYRIYGL